MIDILLVFCWAFCLAFGVGRLVGGLCMGHWIDADYWDLFFTHPIVIAIDLFAVASLIVGISGILTYGGIL